MDKISIGLAALALVLAGSFASVAQADSERDHRDGRSDLVAWQTVAPAADASTAVVQVASLERDNAQGRADL